MKPMSKELKDKVAAITSLRTGKWQSKPKAKPKPKAVPKVNKPPISQREVSIYGLIDWRTCEVRYVGSAVRVKSRKSAHLRDGSIRVKEWVEEAGTENILAVLLAHCDESTRKTTEQSFIDGYREQGADLLNAAPATDACGVVGMGCCIGAWIV